MKYIYLCGEGVAKQLELVGKKKENHNYKQTKNTIYIWPNSTNKETINPTKIKMIKTHYKIKSITIDYALTDVGDLSQSMYSHIFSVFVDINKKNEGTEE